MFGVSPLANSFYFFGVALLLRVCPVFVLNPHYLGHGMNSFLMQITVCMRSPGEALNTFQVCPSATLYLFCPKGSLLSLTVRVGTAIRLTEQFCLFGVLQSGVLLVLSESVLGNQ